ncbi:hypothetical protein SAMN02745216_00117 [Desulfatibacillum alkenivorans DSM 16219]|jgi:hypothetical protein|uniref:Uncharacterized protein n=1 Tax=Desulfatibacillum alkenivorans DSM 16219 TaxID=1121393 RepID=A0A1M6C0T9_9BACT|nr:hypothetical protein SAMN02745216_00117 [Desulfatibacillum alkenivorans DSM 16219]
MTPLDDPSDYWNALAGNAWFFRPEDFQTLAPLMDLHADINLPFRSTKN